MIKQTTIMFLIGVIAMLSQTPTAYTVEYKQIRTFKDLMPVEMFRKAQFGMKIESANASGDTVTVKTTGAIFTIHADMGTIQVEQRIGFARPLAQVRLGTAIVALKISDQDTGFVNIESGNGITIRINGDSLMMIQSKYGVSLSADVQFVPAWQQSWRSNHLVVDEYGGVFSHLSDDNTNDGYDANKRSIASFDLPKGEVYCLGACPPKPYDWKKSTRDQVVWHWSATNGYPTDERIKQWKVGGNILLAQSEVMLWKDWNLAFIPRNGVPEFERMMKTSHDSGLRVIVYTSPFYFLKGTSQESQAVNDKPGTSPGSVTDGSNMVLFLNEIERVMREYKPDGLYFDGQYNTNPAALYALARYSRQIIGEKRILEWHSSMEIGDRWGEDLLYFPHADSYVDMVLRGEGAGHNYGNFNYMRYFVSGYNIHNSTGVLCNNMTYRNPTPEMVEDVLRANARLHTIVAEESPAAAAPAGYEKRLNSDFREWVEKEVKKRYMHR